jgi:hypothetical protein
MDIRELSKPITSKILNEDLAKRFKCKINLDRFSNIQLEDVRNKLRTNLSQIEITEGFDSVLDNNDYQKTRMLLDIVNQEIFERSNAPDEKVEEQPIEKKMKRKQYSEGSGKNVYFNMIRNRAMKESVPVSWINSAISRIEIGESDNAELKAELKLRYDLNESTASWLLCEGEEIKAEIIIASKDMVDLITGWLEDVATMKSEQFLELIDSIKTEMGAPVSQQYQNIIRPALETIYTTLESARQELNRGLAVVSGEETETLGANPMGNPPNTNAMGATPALPPSTGEPEEIPPTPAPAGREKRESVEYSRKLGILLNSKKK